MSTLWKFKQISNSQSLEAKVNTSENHYQVICSSQMNLLAAVAKICSDSRSWLDVLSQTSFSQISVFEDQATFSKYWNLIALRAA